jgi:hypothetical protein
MNNWKKCGRKQSWPNLRSWEVLEWMGKNMKNFVGITGHWAKIWTGASWIWSKSAVHLTVNVLHVFLKCIRISCIELRSLTLIHSVCLSIGASGNGQNTQATNLLALSKLCSFSYITGSKVAAQMVPNSPRSVSQFCIQMASLCLQKYFFRNKWNMLSSHVYLVVQCFLCLWF